FMMHKYGLQVAYRLADRGYPELMEQFARGWMWRFGEIGGHSGYYPKSAGGFEVQFPPESAWTSTEAAIEWWKVNTNPPAWEAQRTNFHGDEGSVIVLTDIGFSMLQDLVGRELIDPIDRLDTVATANHSRAVKAERVTEGYNSARFAVVPWDEGR
ncbi:hypothetical protein, partial [Pacificimonas flava]